jgi:alkylhydroperoxidase family enzyme
MFLWSERATGLTAKAAAFSDAVYKASSLPVREFEAARTRIAQINDCKLCREWRTAPGEVDEEFYSHVGVDPSWPAFSERERLAAEFAERFALDHLAMDDEFWSRLHAAFSDDELVDLGLCVGSWIAFGRLNRVFDVDGGCRIPLHTEPGSR